MTEQNDNVIDVKPEDPLLEFRLKEHAYRDYAAAEFKAAGLIDENGDYVSPDQEKICDAILTMADGLDKTDRTKNAIDYAMSVISRIAGFAPLSEVGGEDHEWIDIDGHEAVAKQCSRLPNLCTMHNGDVMFDSAIGFVDPNGNTYIGVAELENGDTVASAQIVKEFPFEPRMVRINVEPVTKEIEGSEGGTSSMLKIVDEAQLDEVKEFYDFKTSADLS